MDRPMPNLGFRTMSLIFGLRDFLSPRGKVLREADIQPGFQVLDYGCGPGAYIADVAQQVGPSGRIYALDIHPLAIERVRELCKRKQLTNVETIQSDCQTGLPRDSVDVVLLYDIFHMLSEPDSVLAELHRVLKPGGMLSLLDPHMQEEDLLAKAPDGRLFVLAYKGERTYRFVPA